MKSKIIIMIIASILTSVLTCNIEKDCMAEGKVYLRLEYGKALENYTYTMSKINVGYKFDFWKIQSRTYVEYINWAEYISPVSGMPFMDIYTVGQEFKLMNGLFVHLQHYCCHPVISGVEYRTTSNNENVITKFNTPPQVWSGQISILTVGYEVEF